VILIGDIGGTKTLLGLSPDGESLDRIAVTPTPTFQTSPPSLPPSSPKPEPIPGRSVAVAFALAGPIADDGRSAHLTNLPWEIDSAVLSSRFGLPTLRLVNDFAGAAMGAVTSSPAQRFALQQGDPLATAPCLVVGAGTAWAWPSSCRSTARGASWPAKAVMLPSPRPTSSNWPCGLFSMRGTAGLPGNGWFRGRA
jgi:glucokinase